MWWNAQFKSPTAEAANAYAQKISRKPVDAQVNEVRDYVLFDSGPDKPVIDEHVLDIEQRLRRLA